MKIEQGDLVEIVAKTSKQRGRIGVISSIHGNKYWVVKPFSSMGNRILFELWYHESQIKLIAKEIYDFESNSIDYELVK